MRPISATLLFACSLSAGSSPSQVERILPARSLAGLELHHVQSELVTHQGRPALRLIQVEPPGGETMAVLAGSDFGDGEILTELAGAPRQGAPEGARGFVGIAFHVQGDGERFECFYLRPTNGRADDQLRRNHATQYISHPEYPWERLRKENPGVYESYVDLVPAEWTRVRIVVEGARALLFVNGAEQPTLVVNDLKLGKSAGRIAFWIGDGTEAWFSDVRLVKARTP
ncbi:MAG: hypothetical protein ACREAA_16640 [Candidatus Polarisedimenticolia bacterium]